MSCELADWLLAHIEQDEYRADALGAAGWGAGAMAGFGPCVISDTYPDEFLLGLMEMSVIAVCKGEDAHQKNDHIAHWNPRRVMAECVAKRQIVRHFRVALDRGTPTEIVVWHHALRIAALPYQQEPGYREEWRP
ncbi:MAG TPA: DUF6221 family protein [Pseudonocardia sp.]|nr:DUF6221 family protein [Pseudonocardia sp.]